MKVSALPIEGAWEFTPVQHGDPRGVFLEWYRFEKLEEAVGHRLDLRQANLSTSVGGTVRGIHYAQVPPGQAKYLTCVRGALLDVIVDLRVGSPTFGEWTSVRLDESERNAVYVAEGLGHAFCALTEDVTLAYLCSEVYNPAREFAIHALDPELAIAWPVASPLLSARDAAAPTLAEARESGLLPSYADYQAYMTALRA
ncbi:MAG: dTDP-4-dehydrorhamnose 3,5-epimerase family protein [Hamadaea sp.]|nr:dTDP-4-dehydrorhamnose 3,5-epimerase family protein [Hamadaea sp.]